MDDLRVSVVVVSRGRPEALLRCLTALAQLDHPAFEIVVVACPAGHAAAARREDAWALKCVGFDEANISRARNLGICAAAGEIVAFVDDDAVPEPHWLAHLAAPFRDPAVSAATGPVIGRNGLSLQWGPRRVDSTGATRPLDLPDDAIRVLAAAPGQAIKTEGTNMAFLRETLAGLGGFDPAYRFFLDETDLNLRLAASRAETAYVPRARVHHGFHASPRRSAERVPRDLHEIGASTAVFLRKHCAEAQRAPSWQALQTAERRRALRWMQRGPLDALDVLRLMRSLRRGYRDGLVRPLPRLAPLPRAAEGFRPYPAAAPGATRFFVGHPADMRVPEGRRALVLSLSPTALYHRLRFRPDGVWQQSGGLFGRAERTEPLVRPVGRAARAAQERARLERAGWVFE